MLFRKIGKTIEEYLCSNSDNPTIGLLICKDKNDLVAEYTLSGVEVPLAFLRMIFMKEYQPVFIHHCLLLKKLSYT